MKIRTGDTVLVITGKDKGKTGSVLRVLPAQHRVIVTGINMRTKYIKKTTQQAGQKLTFEASMSASNLMILDPKTKKPARVGFIVTEKGKKRVSRLSGEEVTKVRVAAPKKKKEQGSRSADASAPADQMTEAEKKQKKITAGEKAEQETKKPEDRSPFWKKMKFGSAAIDAANVDEGSRMQQDHSVPQQETHVRPGGARGS